jgi:hypothetical protein
MSTKKEIVNRVESRLGNYIIDTAKCLQGCKCTVCFDKYINSVLDFSNSLSPQPVDYELIEEYVG